MVLNSLCNLLYNVNIFTESLLVFSESTQLAIVLRFTCSHIYIYIYKIGAILGSPTQCVFGCHMTPAMHGALGYIPHPKGVIHRKDILV